MGIKTRLVIVTVAITGVIATIVHATPIYLLLVGTILSTGADNNKIREHVFVQLPPAAGMTSEESDDHEDEWTADVFTSGPSNIIVQDVVYGPGGHTGWHSHPGILLSSVISGSIEWYDSKCKKHVYNPGDALTENTQSHYVRNVGSVNAHFMVTYLIAKGQPRRIDQPAPTCAAALGLAE
jgi:quercetin dioxygenase-like cupin family protein